MALPRGKVALNVAISSETRKILKKMAIDSGKTMADLVEEMIKIRCIT
jgi:hypothetical protein